VKGLEMAIEYHSYQKTISELQALYDNDQLNLAPGFQRDSIWTKSERASLIAEEAGSA
jgi:hypothetical protein